MSYAPDESSVTIFSEETLLQGALLTAVGYGVVLTLFVFCFHLLVSGITESNRRSNIGFLVYVSAMFILGTLFQASSARFTQLAYVENRNFPGGPVAYESAFFYIPIDTMGNVAYVISNWLSDGLLVWRYMVICRVDRVPTWIVMFFPCLLYAGSIAMGICYLIQVSTVNSSAWVTSSVNFTLPYASISFALNIIITILIVIRLLMFRRGITNVLGREQGTQYTSIAAMLIESASIYAAFSIFFIVPWATGNATSNIAFQACSQVQIIAPLMIIARVAMGKGWTPETNTQLFTSCGGVRMSEMQFSTNTASSGGSRTVHGSGFFNKTEKDDNDVESGKIAENVPASASGP